MTSHRDAFGELFPHGLLGSHELSAHLYPAVPDLPNYKPLESINTLRGEIHQYVNFKGWPRLNAMFRAYKAIESTLGGSDEESEGIIPPIPSILPRKQPSPAKPAAQLPEIILAPITTHAGVLPTIPAKLPMSVGKTIPFTIRNEPPKIIDSKLGDLRTIKLSTPPVRMPGEKKGTFSHPPIVREEDKTIVIPTNPSSSIIPDKPFVKPAVTQQERIATYTTEQANVGVIIDDWSRVKNERGSHAYTNNELKAYAKAFGIQIDANTNKENLVRLLREYGMKHGLINN